MVTVWVTCGRLSTWYVGRRRGKRSIVQGRVGCVDLFSLLGRVKYRASYRTPVLSTWVVSNEEQVTESGQIHTGRPDNMERIGMITVSMFTLCVVTPFFENKLPLNFRPSEGTFSFPCTTPDLTCSSGKIEKLFAQPRLNAFTGKKRYEQESSVTRR